MQKVTVKDIARDLGLSVGTVYRSLNNTGRVSEKTKKQVLDYAAKVGFQPNMIAQGLAKRKKYRILVLLSSDFPEWWGSIYNGIEKAAHELSEFGVEVEALGYSFLPELVSTSSKNEPIGLLERIERDQVDGIILVPSIHREVMAALDLAKAKDIPVVCVNADAPLPSQRLFYYGPNEKQVGQIAAELVGKMIGGRGNIALVGIESNDFYRLALRKNGLMDQLCRYFPEVNILQQSSFPPQNLRKYVREMLLSCGKDLSALYVYDSAALLETALTVKELGLRHIAVIGHECLPGCEALIQEGWIHTTLCQETFSQGYFPLKLLYGYLLNGTEPDSCYYSNVNIVFRSNLELLQKNENGCGFQ